MATIWSDEETFKLIEPWPLGDDYMHEQLNKAKEMLIFQIRQVKLKTQGEILSQLQSSFSSVVHLMSRLTACPIMFKVTYTTPMYVHLYPVMENN